MATIHSSMNYSLSNILVWNKKLNFFFLWSTGHFCKLLNIIKSMKNEKLPNEWQLAVVCIMTIRQNRQVTSLSCPVPRTFDSNINQLTPSRGTLLKFWCKTEWTTIFVNVDISLFIQIGLNTRTSGKLSETLEVVMQFTECCRLNLDSYKLALNSNPM